MPSTTDYGSHVAGKLAARLTSGTTSGATVTAQTLKTSGSAAAPITWPTGAHRVFIRRKTRTGTEVEEMGVASASQSGATVTLGTLTRQLSFADGSTFSSGGDGITFPANSEVYLAWDVFDAEQTPKKDIANTFAAKQTFSVPHRAAVYADTAAFPAGGNGDEGAYSTADGQFYDYVGGAWQARASGTNPNGSATVAGKFEEATVAEQGSATATGGTGARLIPANANLIKTSAGAADENKLAVMNAAGVLDVSAGGTGVRNPTAGSLYVGAGSSAMTAVAPSTSGNLLTSNGSTWVSSAPSTSNKLYSNSADLTTVGSDTTEQTLIPATAIAAAFWSAGKPVIVDGFFAIKSDSAPTFTWRLKLGTTAILTYADAPAAADTQIHWKSTTICRATGAGGSFMTTLVINDTTTIIYSPTTQAQDTSIEVAKDVSASVNLSLTVQCGTSHANNLVRGRNVIAYTL